MENLQNAVSTGRGPEKDSRSPDQARQRRNLDHDWTRQLHALSELTEMLWATQAQAKQDPATRPGAKKLKELGDLTKALQGMQYLSPQDMDWWIQTMREPDLIMYYLGENYMAKKHLPMRRLARWLQTMLEHDPARKDLIKEELATLYLTMQH